MTTFTPIITITVDGALTSISVQGGVGTATIRGTIPGMIPGTTDTDGVILIPTVGTARGITAVGTTHGITVGGTHPGILPGTTGVTTIRGITVTVDGTEAVITAVSTTDIIPD